MYSKILRNKLLNNWNKTTNNTIYNRSKENKILRHICNQTKAEYECWKSQNAGNYKILKKDISDLYHGLDILVHNTLIQNKDVTSPLTDLWVQCNPYQKFILMFIWKAKGTRIAQTFWKWIKWEGSHYLILRLTI